MDTLKDYGFVRAAMVDNIHELMDFWAEFIVSLEISSGSIRNWRRDGILCQIIELGYNETGRASRSQAFKWFQGHQWIIDPRMGPPRNLGQERQAVDARFRLWTGLPEVAFRDHDAVRPTWSQNKRTCYDFSSQVFNHFALLPPAAIWIDFGFCVCSNGRQEKKLEDIYKRFFELHTFEEFCSARENGTLVSLIDPLLPAFGWRKRTELLDVLQNHSSSSNFKLVWSLKAAILSDFPPAFLQEPCKPMLREYGFYNVRTADEAKELKRLYRRLFLDANVRPLKLHEVATAGELYSFANYVLGFGKEERALFGRLLRKRAADSPAHCVPLKNSIGVHGKFYNTYHPIITTSPVSSVTFRMQACKQRRATAVIAYNHNTNPSTALLILH
ncbi:hypothetical protein EVJ58_g2443 [Rhodofomes roseus]|uniref:Uncharacterized protein n=1 Tax=Rhodofomes roseus TaxID=34475 RepID=A0A4Y9YRD9_9APHY|nr:hypothetical protein EVJ58_g2443 [Rhodofomes roseus]